jgi:hypothetical protein
LRELVYILLNITLQMHHSTTTQTMIIPAGLPSSIKEPIRANGGSVEDVEPEDLYVMRETHKYIFYGPMRKDLKNTFFGAVYLFEKKLRIQAGQKVILEHNPREQYGVALVGQAQNRQVWVWLVSFQTEDIVKRLIVQVKSIVGMQSAEEKQICKSALSRYQRRSRSYDPNMNVSVSTTSTPSGSSNDETPQKAPLSARRLRSQIKPIEEKRTKRIRRERSPIKATGSDHSSEEEEDAYDLTGESSEDTVESEEENPQGQLLKFKREQGDLFMTLLECVVMTLATEYPQAANRQ